MTSLTHLHKQTIDLTEIIQQFLPENTKFNHQLRKLTASGENYGSVLFAVDIKILNDNQIEEIFAVVKTLPRNELVQKMFNTQITFPNEVGFYQTIAPCLRRFQLEIHSKMLLDSFPEFLMANNNLLMIKNIKMEGFDILDRMIGFNLMQAKVVLRKLSELHATFLVFKNKSMEFDKVVPFFQPYQTFVMDDDNNMKMIKGALEVLNKDELCCKYLVRLEKIMLESSYQYPKKNLNVTRNEFFTLVHSDLWTNNIMLNGDNDVKFVDYQLYEYTSSTRDVVFFIFSSVQTEVLQEHSDDLLLYYFKEFIQILNEYKYEHSFTFESFLNEMKLMVQTFEFFHLMTMLPPIYATSKNTKDVEQLEMDSFIFYGAEITESYRAKACFIVRNFIEREWLT